MLNSTLHLNVFGRVNTTRINKDSQCIYQLSRLSTLSHWSLPWSRGGRRREPEKRGGVCGEGGLGQLLFKKVLWHTFFSLLCCNHVPFAVSDALSLRCPAGDFGLCGHSEINTYITHTHLSPNRAHVHTHTHKRSGVFRLHHDARVPVSLHSSG